jgi:hypothetical protein
MHIAQVNNQSDVEMTAGTRLRWQRKSFYLFIIYGSMNFKRVHHNNLWYYIVKSGYLLSGYQRYVYNTTVLKIDLMIGGFVHV